MAGHRKWPAIRRPSTPERQARARADLTAELEAYQATLRELRKARALTQVQLADSMGTTQHEISRIEHQADLHLSTLQRFVTALGGRLDLIATFGDRSFRVTLGDVVGPGSSEDRASREVPLPVSG